MAGVKVGEPFGLDQKFLGELDWDLAISRIVQDVRSDFIYAPHLSLIFSKAAAELKGLLISELKDGQFMPGLPITMEVPKSFRMQVAVASKRFGPSYSRPGSILLPKDRLLYQAFADQAAGLIEEKTDKDRSFSHRSAGKDSPQMFKPTRVSWNELQKALAKYAEPKNVRYILKIDVANFFGSINQHTLINTLLDDGYNKSLADRLENILVYFTNERSSRGILQGMFPSDLFGNYYLAPLDRLLKDLGYPSARYVDDMYVFVSSVDDADQVLRELIPFLRSYDLAINEAKSKIIPKQALITEEPDLEALFENAVEEISDQLSDTDFDADYGFQSEWESEEEDEEEQGEQSEGDVLELKATEALFNSISDYPGQEENIERFCLPLFSKAGSSYAVNHVIDAFKKRSSMSQIYSSYLSDFTDDEEVYEFLSSILQDTTLMDWQRIWVLAALLKHGEADAESIKAAMDMAKDGSLHDALRAVAVIYVGRYGDADRRKLLAGLYPKVSTYVQCAIYYSSRTWPGAERANAKAMWSNHSELNKLLTSAMKK